MPERFDYNRTPAQIILGCQQSGYRLYDLKTFGDLYRNRDLIEMFEGVDVLAIDHITPRFVEMKRADGYGESFEARRAGEVLRWATDRGLAERVVVDRQPAWRILDREPHYMAIGPARSQRVIRIRGLIDLVQIAEANKAANRETKRRERGRVKEIAGYRRALATNLNLILQLSPMELLPEELDRFRIEGHAYLRNYRDVLIDASAEEDGGRICRVVAFLVIKQETAAREARESARKADRETPVVPDDDADAMADIGF